MKLDKLLLRYSPPGIGLSYFHNGEKKEKMLDLFNLSPETDLLELANQIVEQELLFTESVKPKLLSSLVKLQERLYKELNSSYVCSYNLKNHDLPIAGVALNKEGTKCATGSFDNSCKVWDTETGSLLHSINCHTGAVYAVTFNDPQGDRIITGSFDKTTCIIDTNTGICLKSLFGHSDEIVVVKYESNAGLVATASLDKTAKIYDATTGNDLWTVKGHEEAIVSLHFNNDGRLVLTGSFDSNIFLWDLRSESKVASFLEHKEEISNCLFNFDCSLIGSGAVDKSAKIWDVRSKKSIFTLEHSDEVLDVSFDCTGRKFAAACADGFVKIFDLTEKFENISNLLGHQKEVSKVSFSPGGGLVMTGSADGTARLWLTASGQCTQILAHKDEVFNCLFSYSGSLIVTAGNNSICKIWKQKESSLI